METVPPKKAVWAAGLVLLLLAGFGAYQGWRRAGTDSETSADSGILPTAAPVNGAKNASALAEPATPALTEAQIREIARQEARAALTHSDGNATAASSEGGGPSAGEPGEKPAPPAAAARPSGPTTPAGPAEGPAAAGAPHAPPPLY